MNNKYKNYVTIPVIMTSKQVDNFSFVIPNRVASSDKTIFEVKRTTLRAKHKQTCLF